MGFFSNLISLSSFISGMIFGVLVCVGVVLQFLKKSEGTDDKSKDKGRYRSELAMPNPPKSIDALVTPEDAASLKKLIGFLEDFNAPLKSIGGYLKQIYMQRETGIQTTKEILERKQKVIIEVGTVSRMEKEFYDNLAHLKEHTKTLKGVTSFLTELSRAFAGFSKDLSRLSNTAKNNMYKGLKDLNIDTKEDMIVNNWWQALHVSLDYMSSDQDYLASQIADELLTFSVQIHDELTVIEKRLAVEGAKQLHNIKEHLSLYESKRRERDKYREKVRLQGNSATLTTQSPAEIAQRRALKMRINDEQLSLQTGKLYVAQKEFFNLMPRIDADVQLTILKSIVETHSQLLKLTEAFERQQESNKMISKRMKLQLTNAAASLMQMIREEGNLLTPSAASEAAIAAGMGGAQLGASVGSATGSSGGNSSGGGSGSGVSNSSNSSSGGGSSAEPEIVAYEEALRAKMLESGVQGYELSLQKVLEGLLQHCQAFDFTYGLAQTPQSQLQSTLQNTTSSTSNTTKEESSESRGELNMTKESTACLAATNPAILPLLPSRFGTAVGTETCVWFNSFSGRVYRDISHSNYFYNWFCAKLTHLLNKGPRPDYVDEFKVNDVQFGVLPPLLMNVQWAPPCKPGPFSFQAGEEEKNAPKKPRSPGSGTSGSGKTGNSTSNSGTNSGASNSNSANRAFIYDESDTDGSDSDTDSPHPSSTSRNSNTHSSRNNSTTNPTSNPNTTNNSNTNTNTNNTNTNTNTNTNNTNTNTSTNKKSRGRYKAPPPKADDSEFFAACTADMAFRSGIKFTISTKLWINWPRDRYASVPVILYLNLEEISGRIRFGVTRSHSFFSFLGDPLMRINVRNEVGKGAYKFKDFPQLSEFITKKLKAYVHNKIVHPHSHKFRLIWPRNWWPEGTQDEFMGDGEEQAKGNKYGPPPAAPTLQPATTSSSGVGGSSSTSGGSSGGSTSGGGSGVPATPHATPVVASAPGPLQHTSSAPAPLGGGSGGSAGIAAESTPHHTPAQAQSPQSDAGIYHTSTSNTNTTPNTNTTSEEPAGRQRAGSLGSGVAGVTALATAGVQAIAQAGASASHKVEELAEKIKSAGESAGLSGASPSGGGSGGIAMSGGGGSGGSGGVGGESGSSSRYSAMRSKVTQWMHNHASRRASTGASGGSTAGDDHYHPMSRAAQQQASPHSHSQKSLSPLRSPSQSQSKLHSQSLKSTGSGSGSSVSPSPRQRRGSENMQAVMASARQSDLFSSSPVRANTNTNTCTNTNANTPSSAVRTPLSSAGGGGGGGGGGMRSPTIYAADGEEEGESNKEGEDEELGDGSHHGDRDHEHLHHQDHIHEHIHHHEHDHNEHEHDHLFDQLALQSLTTLQREVLKDNLAWDLEVKNVVNRYVDGRRRASRGQRESDGTGGTVVYSPFSNKTGTATGTGSGTGSGMEGSTRLGSEMESEEIAPAAYRAAMQSLSVHCAPRRRSASNLEGVLYAGHSGGGAGIGGAGGMVNITTNTAFESSHSSLTTPALSPAHTGFNSPERRDHRSKSIISATDTAENTNVGAGTGTGTSGGAGTGMSRSRSFQTPDPRWAQQSSLTIDAELVEQQDLGPRVRSYSISDFRPETQDAMFRIHILDAYVNIEQLRQLSSPQDSTTGAGSGSSGGGMSEEEQGSDKLSSTIAVSMSNTSGRGRAHSVTGRTDNIPASTSSHSVRDSHEREATYQPRRVLPRPQSAYISRPSPSLHSLQERLSVASGSASAASADIASKFADFTAKHLNNRDLSQVFMRGRTPNASGKSDSHGHEEHDQEYTQHSLTSMREAIDAEDETAEQHSDNTRETRASLSGPSTGSGSSTLKYMSSMFRSKFGSGEGGSDRKGSGST